MTALNNMSTLNETVPTLAACMASWKMTNGIKIVMKSKNLNYSRMKKLLWNDSDLNMTHIKFFL